MGHEQGALWAYLGRRSTGWAGLWAPVPVESCSGSPGVTPFLSQNSLQGAVTTVPCNVVSRAELASLRCWQGKSWSGACTRGVRVAASAVSSQRGPHCPPGLASPFLGLCSHPTRAGSPSLSSQLEISARGFSQEVLGSTLPWGVHMSTLSPPQPRPRGAVGGQASSGPEGVVDSHCSVPHAEPRVFQP